MPDPDFLAREYAARPAILAPDGATSYAELAQQVQRDSDQLAEAGLRCGERVVLVCPQDRTTVVRALALFELGCPVLPISPELGGEERRRIATAFGAHWIGAPPAVPDRVGAELRETSPPWTGLRDRPLLGLLSSGSTGTPKIVLKSRAQILAGCSMRNGDYGIVPDDRFLIAAPLSFAHGFNGLMLATLLAGACMVFPSSLHPRALLAEIGSQQISVLGASPTLFDLLIRFGSDSAPDFRSLRLSYAIGEALSDRILRSFSATFDRTIWQSYGSSEGGPMFVNRSGASDGQTVALGHPHTGVEVALLDEQARPVAAGEIGEIVVRSAAVGLGYVGADPGMRAFDGDRFFTGDLGVLRDGLHYFAGRKKTMINSAGRKVDPVEVEHVLLRHPSITEAVVVGLQDGDRERVRAVIVTASPLTSAEVMEHCAQSLAGYKIPRVVEFRSSLPRNPNGKPMRTGI